MRVLITGVSRGIGRGLLDHYAAQADTQVMGTVRGDPGEDPACIPLDLRDPAGFDALARRLGDGPLDLLVCNAGVYAGRGLTLDSDTTAAAWAALWAEGFAVNVTGVFLTVRACLPALRRGTGARIAIVSSLMGSSTRAPGGAHVYRASKAAVTNLARNLATDLARDGIAVGVYHPGWVRTDMGGPDADIDLATSVAGLAARIDALTPATTGRAESWDGTPLPF